MKLREGNIIVCDCGTELNPEIVTETDFVKYGDGIATCSNCGASGLITISSTEDIATPQGPTLEARLAALEDVIMDLLV